MQDHQCDPRYHMILLNKRYQRKRARREFHYKNKRSSCRILDEKKITTKKSLLSPEPLAAQRVVLISASAASSARSTFCYSPTIEPLVYYICLPTVSVEGELHYILYFLIEKHTTNKRNEKIVYLPSFNVKVTDGTSNEYNVPTYRISAVARREKRTQKKMS